MSNLSYRMGAALAIIDCVLFRDDLSDQDREALGRAREYLFFDKDEIEFLRDQFASDALGMGFDWVNLHETGGYAEAAQIAFEVADAMMKARRQANLSLPSVCETRTDERD